MSEHTLIVLLLVGALEVKHMFADFHLQTKRMLAGRCCYLHVGRAQHAAVHAVGSALILLLFQSPLWLVLALCAAEWILHFNIDYWKAHHSRCKELDPSQGAFWRAMGLDQLLHHLTYIAMASAWCVAVQ